MSRIEQLIVELRAEIEAAYQRGFVAGAADMRDRIFNAAQSPVAPQPDDGATGRKTFIFYGGGTSIVRAPRGAVGRMLDRILKDKPGLTVTEIEALAGDYDKDVAIKSIGNELRRAEGKKYRRDERNNWFLIDGVTVETETPAESPAGDVFS